MSETSLGPSPAQPATTGPPPTNPSKAQPSPQNLSMPEPSLDQLCCLQYARLQEPPFDLWLLDEWGGPGHDLIDCPRRPRKTPPERGLALVGDLRPWEPAAEPMGRPSPWTRGSKSRIYQQTSCFARPLSHVHVLTWKLSASLPLQLTGSLVISLQKTSRR